MGEKSDSFQTKLSVRECGEGFKTSIEDGRGLSSKIGGITAKLMGGSGLDFYTPETDSVFGALEDDPPAFAVGVGVPRAQGAHKNGTNVHMSVWDRGSHREVSLWSHHSLAGGAHAQGLMATVRSNLER